MFHEIRFEEFQNNHTRSVIKRIEHKIPEVALTSFNVRIISFRIRKAFVFSSSGFPCIVEIHLIYQVSKAEGDMVLFRRIKIEHADLSKEKVQAEAQTESSYLKGTFK